MRDAAALNSKRPVAVFEWIRFGMFITWNVTNDLGFDVLFLYFICHVSVCLSRAFHVYAILSIEERIFQLWPFRRVQVRLVRVADGRYAQKRRVHVSNLTISNKQRVSSSHHPLNREIVQGVFIFFYLFFFPRRFGYRIRRRRHVCVNHQTRRLTIAPTTLLATPQRLCWRRRRCKPEKLTRIHQPFVRDPRFRVPGGIRTSGRRNENTVRERKKETKKQRKKRKKRETSGE